METFYELVRQRPYRALTLWWRNEPVDLLVAGVTSTATRIHSVLAATQNGSLGRYITVMVAGLILMLALLQGGVS